MPGKPDEDDAMRIMNLFNRLYNFSIAKKYRIQWDKSVIIGGRLLVKGKPGSISIGSNTVINSEKKAVPLGYQTQTVFWTIDEGKIIIGRNCGISNATFCSASRLILGDYVTIGGGVKLFDTDFHSLDYEKRVDYVDDNDRQSAPITVKSGAFIGAGSIILKGVTIGSKSIIGAGSVVTKDVPDREIWAGNPAKMIRRL